VDRRPYAEGGARVSQAHDHRERFAMLYLDRNPRATVHDLVKLYGLTVREAEQLINRRGR
jgi:hypothetical protein